MKHPMHNGIQPEWSDGYGSSRSGKMIEGMPYKDGVYAGIKAIWVDVYPTDELTLRFMWVPIAEIDEGFWISDCNSEIESVSTPLAKFASEDHLALASAYFAKEKLAYRYGPEESQPDPDAPGRRIVIRTWS